MPWSRIGWGTAAGMAVTAPLMALFYLANSLIELPFPPYDLFDWITRVLPGPLVTFGLDLFIDGMILVGLDVADSAKTAELGLALLQFFVMDVALIALVAAIAPALTIDLRKAAFYAGVANGLVVSAISLAIGGSALPAVVSFVWITSIYVLWGFAAGIVLEGVLARPTIAQQPAPEIPQPVDSSPVEQSQQEETTAESEPQSVVHTRSYQEHSAQPTWDAEGGGGMNRREFIVRVGARRRSSLSQGQSRAISSAVPAAPAQRLRCRTRSMKT